MDRENEFEQPGGNYPDQGGEKPHAGDQPSSPDTQNGGAAEPPLAAPEPPEDGGPIMDQHPASDEDKIAGIVAQTRADVGTETPERIADVLRQRFDDAGLSVSDDEIAELAKQVAPGAA